MSSNVHTLRLLTDPMMVPYVLLDEYLRTVEMFGRTTVDIAGVRAVMDKACVIPVSPHNGSRA